MSGEESFLLQHRIAACARNVVQPCGCLLLPARLLFCALPLAFDCKSGRALADHACRAPAPTSLPSAGSLIELAQLPMAAWGHDSSQDQGGVLYRDEPLERYLSSCNNIVRVTNSLLHVGLGGVVLLTGLKPVWF